MSLLIAITGLVTAVAGLIGVVKGRRATAELSKRLDERA